MKKEMERADIMRLAAETGLDARTVKRAVERGIDSVRAEVDRVRLKAAATKLGLKLT
jgi:hypothetical protein